jgi:hypothetical protein
MVSWWSHNTLPTLKLWLSICYCLPDRLSNTPHNHAQKDQCRPYRVHKPSMEKFPDGRMSPASVLSLLKIFPKLHYHSLYSRIKVVLMELDNYILSCHCNCCNSKHFQYWNFEPTLPAILRHIARVLNNDN